MLTTKILRLDWRRIWVLGDKMLSELIERDSTWGVGFVPSATLKFSSLAPAILPLQNLSQFSWAISAGHWKGQFPGICPDLSRHQGTLLVNHVNTLTHVKSWMVCTAVLGLHWHGDLHHILQYVSHDALLMRDVGSDPQSLTQAWLQVHVYAICC